jgi:exosortase K
MLHRHNITRLAQLITILLCALTLKQLYSTASPNDLRWILAPTTFLVELVSGRQFEFESHAGYLSSDRSFLIAGSCAGVNFLITSFLMLSLRRLWRERSGKFAWGFIPLAAVFAYLATLAANTARISTALSLQKMPLEIGGLTPNQLHRFEGIFIYFGFLLLLFLVSEKLTNRTPTSRDSDRVASLPANSVDFSSPNSEKSSGPLRPSALPVCPSRLPAHASGLLRPSLFPLLVYYATVLGIPLANGLYRTGTVATDFWEHSLFVLLTPLILILPLAMLRFLRREGSAR